MLRLPLYGMLVALVLVKMCKNVTRLLITQSGVQTHSHQYTHTKLFVAFPSLIFITFAFFSCSFLWLFSSLICLSLLSLPREAFFLTSGAFYFVPFVWIGASGCDEDFSGRPLWAAKIETFLGSPFRRRRNRRNAALRWSLIRSA